MARGAEHFFAHRLDGGNGIEMVGIAAFIDHGYDFVDKAVQSHQSAGGLNRGQRG
ncbi:MAG: hypothetical protein ABSF29_03120 [Tepidisphaeraceae bacterium]